MIPNNIVIENISCPLGCTSNDKNLFEAKDLLHNLQGDYMLVKCTTCGLIRTNPRPTQDSIGYYYPDDYGPYLGTQVKDKNSKINESKLVLFLKTLINSYSTKIPSLTPGNLLEIGCASGSYLDRMAHKGWNVQGIEPSEKAALAAIELGHHVYTGSLESAPQPQENLDLIVGWMVLEHLHDPVNSLKKLYKWSNSDTWLVLSMPNAGSLEFNIFKDKWYALQIPNHLHHFTPKTLEKLLNSAGWSLEKVYHQRNLSSLIASFGYILQEKGLTTIGDKFINFPEQSGKWCSLLLYPIALLFSLFGQTGRMTIWAKPK